MEESSLCYGLVMRYLLSDYVRLLETKKDDGLPLR